MGILPIEDDEGDLVLRPRYLLREQHLLLSGLSSLCVKYLPHGLAEIRSMPTCFKAVELRYNLILKLIINYRS
jgi:hypothetical protein